MAKTSGSDADEQLELDGFLAPPAESGLSLEELSRAYADLLGRGDVPYDEPPADEAEAEPDDDTDQESGEDEAQSEGAAAPDSCEITPRSILEAMLFVGHPGNEPLTSDKVAALMRGVRPQEVDELVAELNENYDRDGCPYRVESVGAGYRLALREEFGSLRDRFYGRIKAAKLSQAAIDVLAVVAYKQPITREAVDQLRGKPSSGLLSQLVRRGLLRIERHEGKPRMICFGTTDRFLQLFGLETLRDLPQSPD